MTCPKYKYEIAFECLPKRRASKCVYTYTRIYIK